MHGHAAIAMACRGVAVSSLPQTSLASLDKLAALADTDRAMLIRTDGYDWTVVALWHGAERVVYRGDLFGAIAFKRRMA